MEVVDGGRLEGWRSYPDGVYANVFAPTGGPILNTQIEVDWK